MMDSRLLIGIACAAALPFGCASFKPLPLEQTPVLERAETQERDDLRVTVAVPAVDEARRLFDSKLHKRGVQPVWIRIENRGDAPAWFFHHSVDADYFPPLEVAWRHHRTWAKKTNREMDEYFYTKTIPPFIPARSASSGFVFVPLDHGPKYVPLEILRDHGTQEFEFILSVPGFRADYSSLDFEGLHAPGEIVELEDESAVRRWVEELTCCTVNAKGTKRGDPINFVLIGPDPAFVKGFLRSRWDVTSALTAGTATRTATSAILGKSYRNAPMSPLFVDGRGQDIGLQKARHSVHQRNHLRLWLAPANYRGTPVWIGQISRDIGSRFTTQSSTFTTHKIDPDVDDARDVLLLDLIEARVVDAFGYTTGVGPASPDSPRGNLTGDPYFTDGLRMVLFLTERDTPYANVRYLEWETPPAHRD